MAPDEIAPPIGSETATFVDAYLRARGAEGRLLDDAAVAMLPELPPGHPLAAEWRARAVTARRLVARLAAAAPCRVVELGCGNGWLSAQLARVAGATVTGVDVNDVELAQAIRVFGGTPQLSFVRGDLRDVPLALTDGAVVVLASALQYVEDAGEVLGALVGPSGAVGVHVVDTPWYAGDAVDAARARSIAHYRSVGATGMAQHYHHHTWDELTHLRVQVLAPAGRPHRWWGRRQPVNPFPWLWVTR